MIDDNSDPPNILFVVWDACRYDYAIEHADFLNELGESNIWFERAIAPSPWSLPSHASLFTGELPHQHGSTRFGDSIDTPLVRELSQQEYTTYGVSANGFASQRTGFSDDFDEFRYTGGRDLYLDGLDVSGESQKILHDEGTSYRDALVHVLRQIPKHDHSIKSLANLFAVFCGELATKYDGLQTISHPLFAPTSDYSYTPEKNTRAIQSVLRDHDRTKPFFLFTNYMDTHRCFKPSEELQKKHINRTLEYGELVRLNEEIAAPLEFEKKKESDKLDSEDLEDVRGLYAGEVETVDNHLRRIHQTLDEQDLLDDTLIIITADHGENLGEVDEMGRQRMGHEASVSEAVLHVPLLLSHPNLDPETISQETSLNAIYDVCLDVATNSNISVASLHANMTDRTAVSEYPATGGDEKILKKYPTVSSDTIEHRSMENSAVVYDTDWKIVMESTGEEWAFNAGESAKLSEAPSSLKSIAETSITELMSSERKQLSTNQTSQLEALGYL